MGYFEERNKKLIEEFTKQSGLPGGQVKDLVETCLAPGYDPVQKLHALLKVGTFSEQLKLEHKAVVTIVDIEQELKKIRKDDSQVRALVKLTGWPVEKVTQIRSLVLPALLSTGVSNPNDCTSIICAVFRALPEQAASDFLLTTDFVGLLPKIRLIEYGIDYVALLPDLPVFQETCKRAAAHLTGPKKISKSSDSPPSMPPGLTQCCLYGKIPFAAEVLNLIGDTKVPFDFSKLCCKFLLVAFHHSTSGEISTFLDTNESGTTVAITSGSLFATPYQDFTTCPQKTPLGELFSFLLIAGSLALHQGDEGKLNQPAPKDILKRLKQTKSLGLGGPGYFALCFNKRLLKNIDAFLAAAKTTTEALRHLKAEAKTVIRKEFIALTTKGGHFSVRKKKTLSKEQIARAKWMLSLKKKRLKGALIDDTTIAKIFTNPEDFPKSLRPPKTISELLPLSSKQAVGQALKRYQDHLASAEGRTTR